MRCKSHCPKSGQTILIVDDREEALILLCRMLEREGHRVLSADSGARALELLTEHDIHLVLVDDRTCGKTGEHLVREIRKIDAFVPIILRTPDSTEKPPRSMLAELDIQGYHDMTDGLDKLLLSIDFGLKAQRRIAQLREREHSHAELVANVSHEFRTPLNIIAGYTDLIRDGAFGPLPAAAKPVLHSIAEASHNLAELVADFLSYSKLEARAVEVNQQLVPTAELAQEIERLSALLLQGREVRFTVEVDNPPLAVATDPVKLRTILRNLVTNAAQFTTAGSICLSIARHRDTLRFAIRDSGPGIRQEDLPVIFEPFRQLAAPPRRNGGGIGLGLALSRKLARLLGGDIEVESREGVGSTFTLVLPATAARDRDGLEPAPQCAVGSTAVVRPSAAAQWRVSTASNSPPLPLPLP